MLDVGVLTKRWYKLWESSIRRKWKRFLYTENKKKCIVFVLYFIVVGNVFLPFVWLLKSDMLKCWDLCGVFLFVFYIDLFDIHPNNLKCGPAEKSPSAALKKKKFLKKSLFACFGFVKQCCLWCSRWSCDSSVTWEIFKFWLQLNAWMWLAKSKIPLWGIKSGTSRTCSTFFPLTCNFSSFYKLMKVGLCGHVWRPFTVTPVSRKEWRRDSSTYPLCAFSLLPFVKFLWNADFALHVCRCLSVHATNQIIYGLPVSALAALFRSLVI